MAVSYVCVSLPGESLPETATVKPRSLRNICRFLTSLPVEPVERGAVKRGSPETEETFAEDGMEKLDTGGVIDEAEDCVAEVAGGGVGVETLAGVGVEDTGVEALVGVGVGVMMVVVFVGIIVVVAGVMVVIGIVFPSIEAVVRGPIIP